MTLRELKERKTHYLEIGFDANNALAKYITISLQTGYVTVKIIKNQHTFDINDTWNYSERYRFTDESNS